MFPKLFWSQYLYLALKISGGTPCRSIRLLDQGIVTLTPAHGTLVSRGTPIGNHSSRELAERLVSAEHWLENVENTDLNQWLF